MESRSVFDDKLHLGLKKNSSRPMRLLESYNLMNEEVEWETEQSLMTNMIQVNDCLADTISGGIR